MDQIVSQVECLFYSLLHPRGLSPGLSLIDVERVVTRCVSKQLILEIFERIGTFWSVHALSEVVVCAFISIDPAYRPGVCPEERVPDAKLVEHDEEIVIRVAEEARNVGATKGMACVAKLQDH